MNVGYLCYISLLISLCFGNNSLRKAVLFKNIDTSTHKAFQDKFIPFIHSVLHSEVKEYF